MLIKYFEVFFLCTKSSKSGLYFVLTAHCSSGQLCFRCSIATRASGSRIDQHSSRKIYCFIIKATFISLSRAYPTPNHSEISPLFLLAPLFPKFFPNILHSFSPFLIAMTCISHFWNH